MKNWIILLFCFSLFACGNNESQSGKEKSVKPKQTNAEAKKIEETYPDGTMKVVGMKRGDTRIGVWKSYYPNGYKWSEVTYVNGHREGPTVTYYANGIMRYEGSYYNDERSGLWMFYDTTGVTIKKLDMDVNTSIPDSLLMNN